MARLVEPSRRRRIPIRRLAPKERRGSFEEVDRPYTWEEARAEAARCIRCARPFCEEGCPAGSPIRTWIEHVAEGDIEAAFRSISSASSLPSICGRVCPVERQCEGACVLGRKADPIAIGMLERRVGDEMVLRGPLRHAGRPPGHRTAIVGSGPAGLAAAGELALGGERVIVLEALPMLGGVLAWGIPPFVLPPHPLRAELVRLRRLGVRFRTRTRIGAGLGVDDLFGLGFEAVILAVGASGPLRLGIPGEDLAGVYSATDYLMLAATGRARRGGPASLPPKGSRVAVVGGGDTAIDVARTAARLGAADVRVLYRRDAERMPARRDGVAQAREEGVIVDERSVVLAVVDDGSGRVGAILRAPASPDVGDGGEGRGPAPVTADRAFWPFDAVVVAIGYRPEEWLARTGLELRPDGTIVCDAAGRTSRPGLFAAGDVAHGADRVVTAMAAGRRAAGAVYADVTAGRTAS